MNGHCTFTLQHLSSHPTYQHQTAGWAPPERHVGEFTASWSSRGPDAATFRRYKAASRVWHCQSCTRACAGGCAVRGGGLRRAAAAGAGSRRVLSVGRGAGGCGGSLPGAEAPQPGGLPRSDGRRPRRRRCWLPPVCPCMASHKPPRTFPPLRYQFVVSGSCTDGTGYPAACKIFTSSMHFHS